MENEHMREVAGLSHHSPHHRGKKFMDTFIMKIMFYWLARVLRPVLASSRWEKSSILFLAMLVIGGVIGGLITYLFPGQGKNMVGMGGSGGNQTLKS